MLADEIVSIVPELAGRVAVIPNAVAVDEFGAPPEGDHVSGELLFVGSRLPTKGIEDLLRAFAIVRASRSDATLRLIGPAAPGGGDAAWQKVATELGIADAVRFEPATDRAGVAAAMGRADLFVHPSPRETFGVVAVEALASGLPVVAVDSGGVTEVLGDAPERRGALAPRGDHGALAAAVLRAFERRGTFDPDELRADVIARFGAAPVAARLVELYESVLGDRLTEPGRAWTGDVTGGAEELARQPTVIAAFSRLELDRAFGSFPSFVMADAALATTGAALDARHGVHVASAGSEGDVADLLGWGRPAASVSGRIGRVVGRALRGGGDAGLSAAATTRLLADLGVALEAAVAEAEMDGMPLLVCLSGLDHLVAAPFAAAGRVIVAPGGLRWLADARAAAQASGSAGAPEVSAGPSDA